jgi:signal transduction histidine kinase
LRSDPRALAALTGLAGVLVTALVALVPGLRFAYRNPELHLALLTTESLIALLAAFLVLGRFRRRRRIFDLVLCCALALLACSNLLFAAVPAILSRETTVFATWSALIGRLLGAGALAAAALAPDTVVRPASRVPVRVAGLTAATLVLVPVTVAVLDGSLPHGVNAEVSPSASGAPSLDAHWAILVAQLGGLLLYLIAAPGFLRRAGRASDRMLGWLGVAAVVAAVGRLNDFLYPSLFTDWVSTGDLLRLLSYLVVLTAAVAEIRWYWEETAHAAALEERRRLARDLHDGMAQELASVARNLHWLDDDDRFVRRARVSAERALVESRRAIAAIAGSRDAPLDEALRDALCAVADREGTRVVLALAPRVRVDPAQRDALVMIASEAVTNAARHGGTDVVRVQLTGEPKPRLRIVDTGHGFDRQATARRDGGGFGLAGMRERAESVGACLRVESRPGVGTEVEVVL